MCLFILILRERTNLIQTSHNHAGVFRAIRDQSLYVRVRHLTRPNFLFWIISYEDSDVYLHHYFMKYWSSRQERSHITLYWMVQSRVLTKSLVRRYLEQSLKYIKCTIFRCMATKSGNITRNDCLVHTNFRPDIMNGAKLYILVLESDSCCFHYNWLFVNLWWVIDFKRLFNSQHRFLCNTVCLC